MIDRIVDFIQGIPPRTRTRWAVWTLLFCVVAWPVTSFTVWSNGDQAVLALSWIAIMFGCVTLVFATDIREQQDS